MEKKLKQKPLNLVRIVLFGPESTGKTTISRHLARHYNTVWAPEYARQYLQDKWNNERKTCEKEDLLPIAIGQMKLENKLAKKADKVLICDTDLLETKVYSEEYYGGFVDENLDKAANKNSYDLYLLTYIDTPWEEDDLRDRPELRLEMFTAFESALKKHNKNYILLKGDKGTRLKKATEAIDKLIEEKENLYSFSDSLQDLDMHFSHQNTNDFGTSFDY
ncbi:MAG: ATP-binding protein [Polaribacter sp.]|uniref:ATP-binding protein n=1 Tax=Polaribacter sp. TaxID=1920175 RepID=UPI002F35F6B3